MFNSKKIIRINKRNVYKFISDIDLYNTENFVKNLNKVFHFGYRNKSKFVFGGIICEDKVPFEIALLFSLYEEIEIDEYSKFIKEIKKLNYQNINLVIYTSKDIDKFLSIYKDKKILKNNLKLQKISTNLIKITQINFRINK